MRSLEKILIFVKKRYANRKKRHVEVLDYRSSDFGAPLL